MALVALSVTRRVKVIWSGLQESLPQFSWQLSAKTPLPIMHWAADYTTDAYAILDNVFYYCHWSQHANTQPAWGHFKVQLQCNAKMFTLFSSGHWKLFWPLPIELCVHQSDVERERETLKGHYCHAIETMHMMSRVTIINYYLSDSHGERIYKRLYIKGWKHRLILYCW